MLVMLLGDSHGDRVMVREALRRAQTRDADALLSVGDLGIWPGPGGKMFLDTIDRIAAQRNLLIYVVPGNHDDYDQIHDADQDRDGWHVLRPRVRAAPRPHHWVWAGVAFLGLGGAASIDGPDGVWPQVRGPVRGETARHLGVPDGHDLGGWWPDERITVEDVERSLELIREHGSAEVMITHDAPAGVPIEGERFAIGDEQRERIKRVVDAASPRHLICGHWHRFRQHRLGDTLATVLSADINPDEPQYAWLHLREGDLELEVPRRWDPSHHALSRPR